MGWGVNSVNNWWHMGSLPGITSIIIRGNNQINWALLLNTRTANINDLNNAVDALVWNTIPTVIDWTQNDFFTNVKDISNSKNIHVYPNPVKDAFSIDFDKHAINVVIKVLNPTGQVVLEKYGLEGFNFTIDLMGQAQGYYIIEIPSDNAVWRGTIFKE